MRILNFNEILFQDTVGIIPTIERMKSFGVKSILDYSVEEDISEEAAAELEMEYVTNEQ